MSLAVVIDVGSVAHAMLIEGTMETMSKAASLRERGSRGDREKSWLTYGCGESARCRAKRRLGRQCKLSGIDSDKNLSKPVPENWVMTRHD